MREKKIYNTIKINMSGYVFYIKLRLQLIGGPKLKAKVSLASIDIEMETIIFSPRSNCGSEFFSLKEKN